MATNGKGKDKGTVAAASIDEIDGLEQLDYASTGEVDWSVFLEEGVIVNLVIKRYRGTTSVDFSELGIDDSSDTKLKSFLDNYIQLGSKKLIPPEIEGQLKSIETSARQNLASKSFDCSAFATTGRFLPKSVYADFKESNEELRERFFSVRDEFAGNYDEIIDQIRKDYKVLAEKLYMQSHPDAKRPSPKYVNAFVDKIVEQIPSSEEIVASFEYSTMLRRIPDYLLNAIRKKNNIDEKVMRIAATNQSIADPNAAKDENAQEAAAEPAEKKTPVKSSKPKDAAAEELDRDISASIASQSQGMVSDFVTGILLRLRAMAYEGSDKIVSSIDSNDGKLVGRASIGAHSLVKDLREMNFYGDSELDGMVSRLETALGSDKAERDVNEVREAAVALMEWSENSMDELNEQLVDAKKKAAPKKRSTSKASNKKPAAKNSSKKTVTIQAPRGQRKRRTIKQRS